MNKMYSVISKLSFIDLMFAFHSTVVLRYLNTNCEVGVGTAQGVP